ncbi:MAG: hypothetical protein HDT42_13650 [Ruminococcaceae bacterium]|nr:hypothetical protein [Oscillospiraceae bacterium]
MTKRELAEKLYFELYTTQKVQNIVDSIRVAKIDDRLLSLDEQLELTESIKRIHIEKRKGLFEDVSAFLALVNQVEEQIKSQSNSK